MKKNNAETDNSQYQPKSSSLRTELQLISEKCTNCDLCQKECEFLRQYGKPKEIADSYDPDNKAEQSMPFECSLCQLCAAVCPVHINPANMFLEMRREAVRQENANNAILELGIKSRRQIPFEEVAARRGLKPTTTENDYLNGDPVIETICFEKNGEIVESAIKSIYGSSPLSSTKP